MFYEPIFAGKPVVGAVRPLQAFLKRLGDALGESTPEADGRLQTESGLYALDDVACVRIRRG